MLALPTIGIAKSRKEHNIDLDVLSDWVEGSILFDAEELSVSDVVDVLTEKYIYVDQDFAKQIVESAWAEIRRRQQWIGQSSPIAIVGQRLQCQKDWHDVPAHSFCLALSYAKWYPEWSNQFGKNFTVQGALFESLTQESLKALFPDWEIHATGWTKTNPNQLHKVVQEISSLLGEALGDLERWTRAKAHEAGLDLLCYRPFADSRVGIPVYLLQCASGGKWQEKLHTPSLRIWTKIVHWAADPKKAFAIPFALLDKEFVEKCNLVDGMLIDRYRLLSPGRTNPEWVSEELKTNIVAWLEPRIAELERDE